METPPRPRMSAFSQYMNNEHISLQFSVPPCPICGKIIMDNDKAVQCYKMCKRWFHKNCINLRFSVYMKFENKIKLRWSCERVECRDADIDDNADEWTVVTGSELLHIEQEPLFMMTDKNIYQTFGHDEELFPLNAGKTIDNKLSVKIMEQPKYKPDKELQFSIQPQASKPVVNELVETYNRRFGLKKKEPLQDQFDNSIKKCK